MRTPINRQTLLSTCLLLGSALSAQTNYNQSKIQKENLGRGVVAIRNTPDEVIVSWRYLSSDPINTSFNIYRDGVKIANVSADKGTFYKDKNSASDKAEYTIKPVIKGKETGKINGSYILPENAPTGYINLALDKPDDGITPAGDSYSYSPNDCSIGDVDGDGEYELIVTWSPSNSHDNAHDGYTGNVLYDCYKINGEKLWRIDLGHNVRAGSHYNQFIVYDLDGDGRAEFVVKTSDGAVDGKGNVIGNPNADYREAGVALPEDEQKRMREALNKQQEENRKNGVRNRPRPQRGLGTPVNQGRILTGNEYLTIFNGLTGEAMQTIDYAPCRGNLADWGDSRANRSDRFLAAVAYLDGIRPSVVMCRGYYTRTVLAAYDWDGKQLKEKWIFDSNNKGNEDYAGQGNHNLRVGDVDGDGCDEIIYGQCTINNDGTGLSSTKMGHGVAMHLSHFSPDLKGMQVWSCHENKRDGSTLRDAATGNIILQIKSPTDVGRCMAADIDPTSPGMEMWSWESEGIRNYKGDVVNPDMRTLSVNMAVWWDGDLLRELLDKNRVSKYDWKDGKCKNIVTFDGCSSNNGTKATPCLQGDILGDWREEVLLRTNENDAIRIYVTPIETEYRFHTFLEDPAYRISIATQNVGYNQPTQPGFYFGPDLKGLFRGYKFKK